MGAKTLRREESGRPRILLVMPTQLQSAGLGLALCEALPTEPVGRERWSRFPEGAASVTNRLVALDCPSFRTESLMAQETPQSQDSWSP